MILQIQYVIIITESIGKEGCSMTLDDIKAAVLEAVKKYPISRVTLFGSH